MTHKGDFYNCDESKSTSLSESDLVRFIDWIKENDIDCIKTALGEIASVNFVFLQDEMEHTLLSLAVTNNCYEIAELLLIRGASPNINISGGSLLYQAIKIFKSTRMLQLLLEYGANVNVKSQSPLALACELGDRKAVKALLKFGADIDQKTCRSSLYSKSEDLLSPLHIACYSYWRHRNLKLIKLILKNTTNVNWVDYDNRTALFIVSGFPEVVKVLLEHGCDPNLRDNEGESVIHVACRCNNATTLKLLLKYHDIDINRHVDNSGNTPFHLVQDGLPGNLRCRRKCGELIDILFHYGGDISVRNNAGTIPEIYAKHDGPERRHVGFPITYFDKMSLLGYENNDIDLIEFINKYSNHDRNDAISSYQDELNKLKVITISVYPKRISFYDLLTFKKCIMMKYSKNVIVLQQLNASKWDFEKKFPHYGLILNFKMRQATLRRELTNVAIVRLNSILGYHVSDNCTEEIFKYLSNPELKKFINSNSSNCQ